MIITHHLKNNALRKRVDEKTNFFLSNVNGGYTIFGTDYNDSRYNGVIFRKNEDFYKVIESIKLGEGEVQELRNNLFNIERIYGNCIERFFTNHTDSILYEVLNYKGYIDLTLDCRKIYDFDTQGRIYEIINEEGCIVIKYTKYKNNSLLEKDYEIFLAIKGVDDYLKVDNWKQVSYDFDKKRGTYPHELYVYDSLKIKIDNNIKLVFAYSTDKQIAIDNAIYSKNNFDFIKKTKENYITTLTDTKIGTKNKEINFAYKTSIKAMDSYLVKLNSNFGLYAGFPWFTQIWTRDEAISLKSLIIEERFMEVKSILFRQLKKILSDGRIPNRFPHSDLGSADGVGWVFKRVYDFIKILNEKNRLKEFLSHKELLFIQKQLSMAIKKLLKFHSKEGLSYNESLETWMDTYYKDDDRKGARIEIQALRLSMYKLMVLLCKTNHDPKENLYHELIDITKDRVKSVFLKKNILCDGKDDVTLRPNIFLAYYIYPELLTSREWKKCFDSALKVLWLPWGGVSTIDKNHKYFVEEYTGENNQSYHRGDSWFFVNNLVAICLFNLDKNKYREYINQIIVASTNEILFKGVIGYHSEVSSAKELRAQASLAQCWSSATYVELIKKVFEI